MNILFVTLFALETNTSVTKSNYGIIKGLAELGHNVTVLMPEIDRQLSYYDDSLDLSGIVIERIRNQNVGQQIAAHATQATGIKKKMLSVARTVYGKSKIFDRTKALISEAKNFSGLDNYYDVIISTSDPKTSHLFVNELIKQGLRYGRWIQHWGDPLAGDISKNNIYPNFYIEKVEKRIIHKADKVIYVSPFTLKAQVRRYADEKDKLAFVPLPCDEGDVCNNSEVENLSRKKLNIVYLGDYSSRIRDIKPLYNACANMEFVQLAIAGNTDVILKEKKNIKVFPRLSQAKAKELENQADVIVSVGNLAGNQIPGKLYYSASGKKHIVVALDGDSKTEMKEYLDSFNRFVCCENTVESLTETLANLRNDPCHEYETPQRLLPINVAREILS